MKKHSLQFITIILFFTLLNALIASQAKAQSINNAPVRIAPAGILRGQRIT